MRNILGGFSPFRTAPRTVVRLALYFTLQNAAHLKSVQYIHQDFLGYCKAYNTSSNPNCNWQLCVLIFLFLFFVFSFEPRVCVSIFYFLERQPPGWYSISDFIVMHLHYLFSLLKFQNLFILFSTFFKPSVFCFKDFKAMSPSPWNVVSQRPRAGFRGVGKVLG